MRARTGVAAALVLVCVFAALAVGVVNARDGLDGSVSDSFDAALTRPAAGTASAGPLGCEKTSVDFYRCAAVIRPSPKAGDVTVVYKLDLNDDGCWKATARGATPAPAGFGLVQGCLAG